MAAKRDKSLIHIITGGSGSGKSAYAEEWITRYAGDRIGEHVPLIYIATMRPYTDEIREKIARHQHMRAGKGFLTKECYTDLRSLEIPENAGILLECVSNLTANRLYRDDGKMRDWEDTLDEITEGIRYLAGRTECLVIVTNEVNSDINHYNEEMERYLEMIGTINRRIAELAGRVTEVVYGIPIPVKNRGEDEV